MVFQKKEDKDESDGEEESKRPMNVQIVFDISGKIVDMENSIGSLNLRLQDLMASHKSLLDAFNKLVDLLNNQPQPTPQAPSVPAELPPPPMPPPKRGFLGLKKQDRRERLE